MYACMLVVYFCELPVASFFPASVGLCTNYLPLNDRVYFLESKKGRIATVS